MPALARARSSRVPVLGCQPLVAVSAAATPLVQRQRVASGAAFLAWAWVLYGGGSEGTLRGAGAAVGAPPQMVRASRANRAR